MECLLVSADNVKDSMAEAQLYVGDVHVHVHVIHRKTACHALLQPKQHKHDPGHHNQQVQCRSQAKQLFSQAPLP